MYAMYAQISGPKQVNDRSQACPGVNQSKAIRQLGDGVVLLQLCDRIRQDAAVELIMNGGGAYQIKLQKPPPRF
jgi:hypothetical protein